MRSYDAVVLPVGFGHGVRNLSALNISTKMAECLASGTVTVIVGPEYSAMVQLARAHESAVIIDDLQDMRQVAMLARLRDKAFRERMMMNSTRFAHECSVERMRSVWRECRTMLDARRKWPQESYV
jgi:hypothetical protein